MPHHWTLIKREVPKHLGIIDSQAIVPVLERQFAA